MPCFSRRNGNSATLWRQKACVRFAAGPWARSTAQRQRLRPPTHPLVAPAQDAPLTCHRNTNRTTHTPTTVPSPEIRSDSIRSDPIRSTVRFCSSLFSSYFVSEFCIFDFYASCAFYSGVLLVFSAAMGAFVVVVVAAAFVVCSRSSVSGSLGSVALRVWGSARGSDLLVWPHSVLCVWFLKPRARLCCCHCGGCRLTLATLSRSCRAISSIWGSEKPQMGKKSASVGLQTSYIPQRKGITFVPMYITV